MSDTVGIALWCEDIRQEAAGAFTLIGTLSDNIALPAFPSAIPKLGIFVRVNLPVADSPQDITVMLVETDGQTNKVAEFGLGMIIPAMEDARAKGNENVGLIGVAVASPFSIRAPGHMFIEMHSGEKVVKLASLQFIVGAQDDQETAAAPAIS